MTVRPSLLPPDTTRARQFAAMTRPRGSTLAADTDRAVAPSLRSAVFALNPNRAERRWGTVSVDVEMAQRAVEARRELEARASMQRPRKHLAAVAENGSADATTGVDRRGGDAAVAARESHPAGGGRRQRPVATRRTGVGRPAARRSGTPAARRSGSSSASPASGPVSHPAATTSEAPAPRRFRSGVATAEVRTSRERAASQVSPASSVRKIEVGRSIDVGAVDGATALAPVPQLRWDARGAAGKRAPVREPRADLRVARPPRLPSTPRQRRLRFGFLLSSAFVLLFGVFSSAIALHATLAKNQLLLDEVRVKVTVAERLNQRLRVEVAGLEAPAHVIGKASELGLVPADRVTFVSATVPASSTEESGATS